MVSKNVGTALALYESFNKRDLDAATSALDEKAVFEDHGLGITYKSRAEFRDALQGWITGFSDGKVVDAKALDAGDTVIVRYTARGTNDGPMGPYTTPSKRTVSVPFCDILEFDEKGKIIRGETYFDMLSLMVQMGHAQRPTQ